MMYNPLISVQLPLLGALNRQQLKETINESIIDEATAAEFYGRLLKEAPDDLHKEFIEHAYEDEIKHLSFFDRLYYYYFSTRPQYKIEPIGYFSYKEGISTALKNKLHAAEFYRDVQLSANDQITRDTFFLAMVDELRHATMFSTLYGLV